MIYIFILFIPLIHSIKKSCYHCKNYIGDKHMNNFLNGYCVKFRKILSMNHIYQNITDMNSNIYPENNTYHTSHSARYNENMCGKNGRLYDENDFYNLKK